MERKIKRKVKDTVFTDLFSDPRNVARLYNALHPKEKPVCCDDIEIITLENILTDSIYNDLGFVVSDKLIVLAEAQSTWSDNIAIRMFEYSAETYSEYLSKTKQNVYGRKPVKLPKPEYYVIYTGDEKIEKNNIRLSRDFFKCEDCALDMRVDVIQYSGDRDILDEYILFCKISTDIVKSMGRTQESINEIMRVCREKDVLKEYLTAHEREVHDMMFKLFDEEEIQRATLRDAFQDGIEQGIEEGTQKERQRLLDRLISSGMLTREQAAAAANL